MDYSYILHSAIPRIESFKAFGFEKSPGTCTEYICKKTVTAEGSDFFAIIKYFAGKKDSASSPSMQSLSAEVFDAATGDKYTLFDMPSASGAFIGKLREQIQLIIEDFRKSCFTTEDLYQKYIDWLTKRFSVQPDYPWPEDSPDSFVFRCPDNKWFALVMKLKYKQLGFESGEEKVWAVNLKHEAGKIDTIVDRHSIFPAWHMNKKHWITVLLTAVTDFEKLCELTERSYELVNGKKKSL